MRSRRRGTPGGGRSARIAARTSGSAMRAARSATGRSASASYVGRPRNGCDVRSPQSRPCPCELTCGTMRAPSAFSRSMRASWSRHWAAARTAERERDREAGLARHRADPVDLAVPRARSLARGAGQDRGEHRVGRALARRVHERGDLLVRRRTCRAPRGRRPPCAARAGSPRGRPRRRRRLRRRARPCGRCRRRWRARWPRPARPSRTRAPRRAGPGRRRRARGDAVERVEVLADRSPSPTGSPRAATRRGCPRRPP